LDNILGTPPPPPPPNVPSLPENAGASLPTSVRQRLEQHRKNPPCSTCHAQIDPWGLALEHYDAIGKWHAESPDGKPIDASGTLMDGTKVDGLASLRELVLARREQFVGTVAEKLLTYALGRSVEYYDRPALRKIVRDSTSSGSRWSSLIVGIVKSVPFQMRRSLT
jgi:hypothetical protein